MKKIYTIIFLYVAFSLIPSFAIAQCEDVTVESLTNPGPYEVATLTEEDGIRNGPDYKEATIYYPTNATPPFASIAIVPGFFSYPSSVEEWGPFYASHGIVTIIIGTNAITDIPDTRALALLDALETLRFENNRATSPLENNLDENQFAVSGWSMGGGGAQLAAVQDDRVKGVVALCPWLLGGTSLDHDSPVLILSGQNDPTAPPVNHADVQYNATPNTTNKLLFEVRNGNHSVANTPNGGDGAVGKLALSWLKLYVEKDNCYCSILKDSLLIDPPAASKVLSSFTCELLNITDNKLAINVFPNPTKNLVTVDVMIETNYKVYSVLGQLLLSGELNLYQNQVDFSGFANGMYYLQLGNETIRIIKN